MVRDPYLEDPVAVGSFYLLGDGALRQEDLPNELAIAELGTVAVLTFLLGFLLAMCMDAYNSVGDRHFHVFVRVDARQLGPHDQGVTLLILLGPKPPISAFEVQPPSPRVTPHDARPVDEVPSTMN
jgi:hypothetical protein